MCDLTRALRAAHSAAASCFETPPKTLRVWARGASVRCNAALQMAALEQKPIAQCAQTLMEALGGLEAFKEWSLLSDGLLATAVDGEWLSAVAHALAQKCVDLEVDDSRAPLFFETCALIRARHVLTPPGPDARLDAADWDDAADAARMIQRARPADICLTARRLEARLDDRRAARDDLCAHALAGALSVMLQKARPNKRRGV